MSDIILDADEFVAQVQAGPAATRDDQSLTRDGRRLDSRDAVIAFVRELKAARAKGATIER